MQLPKLTTPSPQFSQFAKKLKQNGPETNCCLTPYLETAKSSTKEVWPTTGLL